MTRTVLFLPQNDSHAETVALLNPELAQRGCRSDVLDMDGIYHQEIAGHLDGMTVIPSGLVSDCPFYRLSPLDQVRFVTAARPLVRRWLSEVDAVVAFNDGALQRLVLTAARRRGISTDLVLDGMITYVDEPRSFRSLMRHALRATGRWLERTSVRCVLPIRSRPRRRKSNACGGRALGTGAAVARQSRRKGARVRPAALAACRMGHADPRREGAVL